MFRKTNVILSAIALLTTVYIPLKNQAQNKASESKTEILDMYPEFIDIEGEEVNAGGQSFLHVSAGIKEPAKDHILFDLVKENEFLLLYLLTNWTHIDRQMKESYYRDSLNFPGNYMKALQKDSLLRSHLLPILSNYLRQEHDEEKNSSDEYETVSWREVLNVAIRFFYPDDITPEGSIRTHICVGINGMKDLEGERNPYAEALAYSTINSAFLEEQSPLITSAMENLSLMNDMNLSTDPEVKIKRAQGVIWSMMYQEPELLQALKEEYEKIKTWYPLIIGEE